MLQKESAATYPRLQVLRACMKLVSTISSTAKTTVLPATMCISKVMPHLVFTPAHFLNAASTKMTLIISVARSDEMEKASPVIRILGSCQSFGNSPPCQWALVHSLRCTTLALTATCTTEASTTRQQVACGRSSATAKQTNQKLLVQFHLQREKNSTTLSLS